DNYGRLNLTVTRLFTLIKKEVYQRSLELRTLSLVDREAGAGDLDTQVKVNDVIFLYQLPVGNSAGMQLGNSAPAANHNIVFRTPARGNKCVWQVGQPHQFLLHLACHIFKRIGKLLLLL